LSDSRSQSFAHPSTHSGAISIALKTSGALALRAATSSHHQEIDRELGLPGSIQTLNDYRVWLQRFFGLYCPLEIRLREFSEWCEWDIAIEGMGQVAALSCDLTALQCDITLVELAPDDALPRLRTFAQALGALYVLEGSKLGGRFILLDLAGRLGNDIAGSDAFFAGYGSRTELMWTKFRSSIDRFAAERPEKFDEVIEGAQTTFVAVREWLSPLRLSEPR
jgi:heme oxygenase